MSIRDAGGLLDGADIHADVCIVGGGPAGISLALSLADSSLSVVLLESGGVGEDEDDRDLNVGSSVGLPYYDLDETRHRALGGSSQRWAGWCRTLDRSDFESRSWVDQGGWPITFDELAPFYDEAAVLCEIDDLDEAVAADALPSMYRTPFVGNGVEAATWVGSPPTKFGDVYGPRLEASDQVDVYLRATAVGVDTTIDGTAARGVRFVNRAGNRCTVHAPTVVLSAGAIETPRLLLASRETHANGLGNGHDLVGRTFMEHPHLVTARLLLLPPGATRRPFLPGIDDGVAGIRSRLAMQRPSRGRKVAYVIDAERRSHEATLNFSTHLRTISKVDRESSDTYQAFKLLVGNLRSPKRVMSQIAEGRLPEGTGNQIAHLVRGAPELAQVVWEEALKQPRELALYTQCEQSPNLESRVTIDPRDRDASGLPRVRLDWRLQRLDKESVIRSHEILGAQFLASGLGVVIPEPAFLDDGDDWGPNLRGGHHHMGTARMSDDPHHGVVDRNCQVHGVAGLYVGDGSVFPTVGYANPLMTVVAVARRLGAHLIRHRG